jgi:hypothetical protein
MFFELVIRLDGFDHVMLKITPVLSNSRIILDEYFCIYMFLFK